MTQKDYLISLMHNFSSVSLGFSGHVSATQDLRSRSLDTSQRSLQRFVAHNLTTMSRGDTVKKKTVKKYSTSSEEVYPVRENDGKERETSRSNMFTKVDVRHVKEGKKFGALASYGLTKQCDQSQCPVLQERLKQHKTEHHRHHNRPKSSRKLREQGVNVSPSISGQRLSKCIVPLNNVRSVQTDITLQDLVVHKNMMPNSLSYTKEVPLKRCETRDIVPNCNFYKEHLQNEVMGWLLNVPIFYSMDFTTKHLKDNIVNVLVDKIDKLSPQANNNQYKTKVKVEIDDCLNLLPMWLPNSVSDQTLFKNGLRNKLYSKIKQLNTKFLGVQDEKEDVDTKSASNTNVENVDGDQHDNELISREIHSWLSGIKFTKAVSRKRITDTLMNKISPLLKVSVHTRSYKLMLKGEIVDVLDELPIHLVNDKNKLVYLNKYAENLANKLLGIQIKLEEPVKSELGRPLIAQQCASHVIGVPIYNSRLRLTVYDKINKALGNVKICSKNDVKQEICDTILNSLETLRSGVEANVNNEIFDILRRTNTITEEKAKSIAKKIKLYVKIALKQEKEAKKSSYLCVKPQLSGVLSIYRSHTNMPVTSTPKKPKKKEIPRLNPEEKSYMNKVADLIRAWMETLPTTFEDDQNYKDTIINDLAGDIMDEVKREQLSPDTNTEKDKHLNYIIHRWLFKFHVFEDLNDAKPCIENFLQRLKQIPEPPLTTPQHGTRQTMRYLKRIEKEFDYDDEFVPEGIDILEDQISVWMNEQPTEIYTHDSKKKRSKIVKDLALTLQDRLRHKSPENEIENDINRWLDKIVKPKEKEHIGLLTQNLKEKIIHVPQDATLEARHEKRKRQRAEYRHNEPSTATPQSENANIEKEDPDRTMKEFILKYIEHNYDIDDAMARGAFAQLLKIELIKLSPPTRKEVYDNYAQNASHETFKPEKLNEVLEYIKIISDWLQNIPIDPLYNTAGNMPRVDFVNDLARNIQEVEEHRKEYPNDMDFNVFISSVIGRSLRTYNVPVLPEHQGNEPLMVNQLLSKIIANRSAIQQNSTIGDIKEQNLSEFIEEYIRVNGREIADDQLKLEVWAARLQQEIKRMIHEGADPLTLCKGQVYENFSKVPIPGKESVRRFSLEIACVKEISDWLKNLPLLPIDNVPNAQQERIQMITELAQKIAEKETKRNADPTDNTSDKELVQYITIWISKLPLDPRKDIVMPIVIQQLMNSVDKVARKNETLPDESQFEEPVSTNVAPGLVNIEAVKDPGAHIVEFIENWCNKLPIKVDHQNTAKEIKDNIAKHLYQKIVELNVDPQVVNDHVLYKNLLEDEIDTQFENLPQDFELQNRKESMKTELLNTVLEMKKIIDEKSSGENYKHRLETTIDAAIPDPVQSRQVIDPGFEIYKHHLANMFILDNFDHSNEDVKSKYENKIKEEIDKYFESAQNRNALPVTKDQIFNELYGELFKVPMPNKEAIVDEVEEIKTRCEVEAWFEELPLREAEGVIEHLEWDQIVSTLAKRIHEIEKNESNPEEVIKKEIIKWLKKLPLLPAHEDKLDQFTEKLQQLLKSTKESRKYVAPISKKAAKGKAMIKNKGEKASNTSQVAGSYQVSASWANPPSSPRAISRQPVAKMNDVPRKKSGDLIEEIVEEWCNQLPLIGDQTQNKMIKDNISTQIIMKICELNMDADIFNDNIIYDQLLDEVLEKIMSDLLRVNGCCGLQQSKPARKYQLKEMIKSIKPLIKEEKRRHEYKAELNDTVVSILNDHSDTRAKMAEFNKLKDDIVDYFVEYNYNQDNNEAKQIYKGKVHDAVIKYVTNIQDKSEQDDPLVRRNQLLCELSKIPVPNNAVLKQEVEEIKMKNEVEQFFKNNSLDDNTDKTAQMKKTLTKRLTDIEKSGHTDSSDKKMTTEISKCLNKINKNVSSKAIEDFVIDLKNNEAVRKSPPLIKTSSNEYDVRGGQLDVLSGRSGASTPYSITSCPGCRQSVMPHQVGFQQPAQYLQVPTQLDLSHCSSEQQWLSLAPATPLPIQTTRYYDPYIVQGITPDQDTLWHPPTSNQSQYQTDSYDAFKSGSFINSSLLPQGIMLSQYNSHLPAQREQDTNRSRAAMGQVSEGNAYQEPMIRIANGNASQYSHGQSYEHPYLRIALAGQNAYQNYDSNHTIVPPRTADLSPAQVLNYDQLRPVFSSSPQQYLSPQIGNLSQRYSRPQGVGPYTPSQNSAHGMPVSGQVATPRTVQGEAQLYEASVPGDVTPESLFQAPTFRPRRLYSPLTVPEADAAQSNRTTRPTSARSSRRDSARELNRGGWTEDERNIGHRCRCDKKLKKYDSGPYCMIPMDEYCNDCGGFYPMWCKMPLPPYFYLH